MPGPAGEWLFLLRIADPRHGNTHDGYRPMCAATSTGPWPTTSSGAKASTAVRSGPRRSRHPGPHAEGVLRLVSRPHSPRSAREATSAQHAADNLAPGSVFPVRIHPRPGRRESAVSAAGWPVIVPAIAVHSAWLMTKPRFVTADHAALVTRSRLQTRRTEIPPWKAMYSGCTRSRPHFSL